MKKVISKILGSFGYEISRVPVLTKMDSPYSALLDSKRVVDLENMAGMSLRIPGMVSPRSGQMLYTLCYMQELSGDVVEIGSWQGRSTSFLARAVENSNNGKFYAIDHFRGNIDKETLYVVGKSDLSDLKDNFLLNIKKAGLSDAVNLLDMPNDQAIEKLSNVNIRFLFVDGDHTKEGVEKDIELFFPRLVDGAIVVFDDFSESFPGLLEAIEELLNRKSFSRVMTYKNTLVVKL